MPAPARSLWSIRIACALAALLHIAIFRWGVILPDTVVQYGQVLSGRYEDWHPPVTAWIWRQIGGRTLGSAPFLCLVVALAWGGLALAAGAMRRRAAAIAIVALGLSPILFGQLGSILKDSLLTAACLAAAGVLIAGGRRWPALPLAALAAAVRFNGFAAAAPLIVHAIAPRLPARPGRWLAAMAVAGALALGASTLVNQVLLAPERQQPFLSLVAFDLAGIRIEGGANHLPLPDRLADPRIARCYAPAHYNLQDDPACDIEGPIAAATRNGGAIRLWLGAIAADPPAYARHRLAHFNANQRWLLATVPDDAVYLMSAENRFGLAFHAGPAAKMVAAAAGVMAESPLGRPATWLAVAIGLLAAAPALAEAALVRTLAASAALYGLSYLVVSVAGDLRYNLWTMAGAALALILALADPQRRAVRGGRLAAAAVPVVVVVTAEFWVWLRP